MVPINSEYHESEEGDRVEESILVAPIASKKPPSLKISMGKQEDVHQKFTDSQI